jgi:uncharacterized membrane protein
MIRLIHVSILNPLVVPGATVKKGDQEMIIEHSVVINRPVEEVFDVATCLRRCVVWRSAILASAKTSEGPVGVGTTFDQDVRVLGMTRTNTAVITAYEPPHLFAYEHVTGLNAYQARFTFQPENGGTRFTVTVDGEPHSAWLRIVPTSLLLRWIGNTIEQEMATLKMMMENEVDLEVALAAA